MIKSLVTLFLESADEDEFDINRPLTPQEIKIIKRKEWVYKNIDKDIEKKTEQFNKQLQKKIKNEIEQTVKSEEEQNLEVALQKAKSSGTEPIVRPVDVEAITAEIIKKYENETIKNTPEAYEWLTVINAFSQRGMSDDRAKEVIDTLKEQRGGTNLISSLYYYVENSPDVKIKDIVGKDLSYADVLSIINDVIAKGAETNKTEDNANFKLKTISSFEFKQLLELNRSKTLVTLLFSDIEYKLSNSNFLAVDGAENLTIKNISGRLINTGSGPEFIKTIISGFKALKQKYNVNTFIPEQELPYNISPRKKSWLVDRIGWDLISIGKVPRKEVVDVIVEAFKKLFPNAQRTDMLLRLVIPHIAASREFNYQTFIDNYFIYSLYEYIAENKLSYIIFLNNDIEKMYVLDCSDKTAVATLKNKIDYTIPQFTEAAKSIAWSFGITLK